MKDTLWEIIFIVPLTIAILFITGCDFSVESNFQLAPESRLPRWFNLSEHSRKDLSMEMIYYTGGKVKVVLYKLSPERKKLIEKTGTVRWHPITERQGYDKYPGYNIITVDGVEEVFKKIQEGNIIYVTDDQKVTSGYRNW